ncbi:MAG: hypothetical protein ACKO0Z_14950 [Betaproteobacteria bacterium]
MAGVGGYQRPSQPAAVSGPGKFSQRTDGKPSVEDSTQAARYISGMPYGEGADLNAIANAAPLSAAPDMGAGGMSMPTPPNVVELGAPTQRPSEPVTSGIPFGPGSDQLDQPLPPARSAADEQRLYMILALLQAAADQPGSSDDTRNALRRLRGSL